MYRLSGLAVLTGMTIEGIASILYSRAGGVALYLDPLVPADDLAKLFGSLIFVIGFGSRRSGHASTRVWATSMPDWPPPQRPLRVPFPGQPTVIRIDAYQWVQNVLEQWQLAAAVSLVVACPPGPPPTSTGRSSTG